MQPYYQQIPTTMCDFHDFYKRIAKELPDNCRIAEVGVADGYSALMLAYELNLLGKKFEMKMIDSCDYGHWHQANEVMRNIIRSELGGSIDFIQVGSLDASCYFPDNYFHFVFIDASHKYEPTKADIRLWTRKVMDGHILAGHDYHHLEEVRNAVDEVVSPSILKVEKTTKDYGVWWFLKEHNTILK